MKSWMPYTVARLRQLKNDDVVYLNKDDRAVLKHAHDVLTHVGALVQNISEAGHPDPRAVHAFLTDLYITLTGRAPDTLRTTLPLDEWDRQTQQMFETSAPLNSSSLINESFLGS
jgi:hypothetical protein